jgi:hypothetical protein
MNECFLLQYCYRLILGMFSFISFIFIEPKGGWTNSAYVNEKKKKKHLEFFPITRSD